MADSCAQRCEHLLRGAGELCVTMQTDRESGNHWALIHVRTWATEGPTSQSVAKIVAVGGAVSMVPLAVIALTLVVVLGAGGFDQPSCGGGVSGSDLMSTSILGPPSATARRMATWYRSSDRPDPAATIGVSIDHLTGLYVLYGTAEGVRPEVAFVQAVVETGGFSNDDSRRLNNFAGIGHCDSCASGMAFPSVAIGVDAQVQLLHRVVDGNGATLTRPVVAPEWGGRQASDLAGLAGNWASSPIYAETLASTLGSLLASAGTALTPGTGTSGCSGSAVLPVPRSAIKAESRLTKPHQGFPAADIPVPAGTDVFAPVSGTVTAAPVGGDCGLGVSVRDADGDLWTLCHGADGGELVHPGDKVAAGQLVMHSGWTGRVEPPSPAGAHLHVQITLPSGTTVCPQAWLDAVWRRSRPPAVSELPSKGCTN